MYMLYLFSRVYDRREYHEVAEQNVGGSPQYRANLRASQGFIGITVQSGCFA